MATPATILVADIGGTNTRFAVGRRDASGVVRLAAPRSFANDLFAGPEEAIRAYLADAPRPDLAAFALAGPVRGGTARLTNRGWTFTTASVAAATGARRACLLNDFAAAALSLRFLDEAAFAPLGGPLWNADALRAMWGEDDLRISVLGPGTGLGHAILARLGGEMTALDTEGGHAAFAAWDEETWAVQRAVTARFGRCSLEHLLSGPGLSNIHTAIRNAEGPVLAAADITARAEAGEPAAVRAVSLFCRILGGGAGDIALATGARCVVVLGGVAQALSGRLADGAFRAQFEAKGQFEDYMRAIPTLLARDRYAGLIGAAASLCPDASAILVEND